LLKKAKANEGKNVDVAIGDHPEGAIDAEVARIASENASNPDGLATMETIIGASTDDIDQVGESEV
jgi:hypothetical protein